MLELPAITTIGFEGEHRSGKGTQIAILKNELESRGITVFVIKGDGRRPFADDYPVKLDREEWKRIDTVLGSPDNKRDDWDAAAYRLARELIVVRDRVFPKHLAENGINQGVLLVDRSVLSRGAVVGDGNPLYTDEMRPKGSSGKPKGRAVGFDDVVPDIIFNIQVPTEELLRRIDPQDPKAEQRREHIKKNIGRYERGYIESYLPDEYKDRVVYVDGEASEDEIHTQII